ncbi:MULTISPECIES: hypothetical protein [unclassified Caulobacter]|jgi:hypothetical protein|uniref:hypothetical protein n=1 Tax=unclassified Caulobacter TaxID=2648921 RepID=UPI0006F628B2|nr:MULTISPECIES: hypothetical protein [unclassified Caulobacter]KQV55001.1 hypothetical protein ASC62_22255 [Caulobacter sp. Root342]KQV71624.1 hypothetical protein ASC70_24190 [Caulobacter sp. Root343]
MPKSKPPRRKRQRHLTDRTKTMLDFYDDLERITARAEREAEQMAHRVPPAELAAMRATCAENRRIFAEARAELMTPSRTPVLDRLVTEARRREGR